MLLGLDIDRGLGDKTVLLGFEVARGFVGWELANGLVERVEGEERM
jgi:hypothetical protein